MTSTSIRDAAAKIRRGESTSRQIVEQALKASDELDLALGTYITRFDESALEAADRADRELQAGTDRGPSTASLSASKTSSPPTKAQPQANPSLKTHLGVIKATDR